MFGRSFRIATIGGIPVNVDSSWIWIAVLAVYSLSYELERRFSDLGAGGAIAYAVFGAILFFGSVLLHELAHAVTARVSGIKVDGITLVFFGGFTAARAEEKGPGPAFTIAALGPATTLALGGLFWAASSLTESTQGPISGLLGYVGWVNLLMAVFNILPGLPLDGGRMLQAAVWRVTHSRAKGTTVAAGAGMVVGGLLIGAALLAVAREDLRTGLWLGIIGLFVYQGARTSGRHVGLADRLASASVADAMEPPPTAVPADLSLSETLDRYLRGHEQEAFPVVEDGRVLGMISFGSARDLGARDPLRPAREALTPLERVLVAHPDERLDEVTERLGGSRSALVLHDGELVGAITAAGVQRWAAARAR